MPSLNHLTCHIELVRSNIELREYKNTYKDGYVETFIAVPDHSSNFQVRLTSDDYVAPGLAMFVFMDGKYQCNRNRRGFRMGNAQTPAKLFELVARQKEELQDDGKFIASSWSFNKLDIVAADEAPDFNEPAFRNIGNIEVIVLRTKNKEAYFDAPLPPRLYGKSAKGVKSGSTKDNVGKSTKGLKTNTKVPAGAAAASTMLKADNPKLKAPNPRAPSTVSLAETLAGRSLVSMFGLFDGAAASDDPQFEHGRENYYYNQYRPQSGGSMTPKEGWKRDDQSYIYRHPSSRNASRLGYKQVETILTPPRQSSLHGQAAVPSLVINHRYTDRPPVERRSSVSTALAAAYARQGILPNKRVIQARNAKDNVVWDNKSSKSMTKQEQEHGGNRRNDTAKKSSVGGSRWDNTARKSSVGGSNREDTARKRQSGGKNEDDAAKKSNTDGKDYSTAKTSDAGGNNPGNSAKKSNSGAKNRDNSAKKINANNNNWNNLAGKRNERSSGTGWNNEGNDRSDDKKDTWVNQSNVKPAPKKSEANWEKSSEKKVEQWQSPSHHASDTAIADAVSYIKPYWADWYHRPKPSMDFITKNKRDQSTKEEQLCIRPAEPPLRVPVNLAEEHNVDTQVRAGKGVRYVHKTQHPDYLDTMEKPFAVFAFKFRSRETLKKILDVGMMEDVVDVKKQMLALSKEELVEELLRIKVSDS
ncbi:hypothetical protein B0A49_04887 [Cryomyces minteri]|uniref:Uncharacterized protein n=1 Tax=Cryomyces minteri TaxID=331657 RepID=A0A4U0XCE0_9PEZI|nr:hypothetical protein B0A49_04887 [Cryomyces minteri]